jgi:hypothetical protein
MITSGSLNEAKNGKEAGGSQTGPEAAETPACRYGKLAS